MSEHEKLIKINSLLILILHYRLDKSIEPDETFRASVFELLGDIGFLFPQENTYHKKIVLY
jgi:hypothetical protein